MLPSQKRILKRNDGFKELVLTCFGECVNDEHERLYPLKTKSEIDKVLKAENEENGISEPEEGYYVLPAEDERLFVFILAQLKNNIFINPASQFEAKPHFIEAILAMFKLDDDDITYTPLIEGKVDYNNYVDWDESTAIIKAKIIDSEFLYGLAL